MSNRRPMDCIGYAGRRYLRWGDESWTMFDLISLSKSEDNLVSGVHTIVKRNPGPQLLLLPSRFDFFGVGNYIG